MDGTSLRPSASAGRPPRPLAPPTIGRYPQLEFAVLDPMQQPASPVPVEQRTTTWLRATDRRGLTRSTELGSSHGTPDFDPSKPTPKPTPIFRLHSREPSFLPVSEAGDLGSIPSARTISSNCRLGARCLCVLGALARGISVTGLLPRAKPAKRNEPFVGHPAPPIGGGAGAATPNHRLTFGRKESIP